MKTKATLLVTLLSTAVFAGGGIIVKPNQLVVQVKGVVCSFCAYGAEKNVSKVEFVDRSFYGKDGVLVDIDTHRITVALDPQKKKDIVQIQNAIEKGGYDTVSIHLHLVGTIVSKDGLLLLKEKDQLYELTGQASMNLKSSSQAEIQVHVVMSEIKETPSGKPLKVVVDKVNSSS